MVFDGLLVRHRNAQDDLEQPASAMPPADVLHVHSKPSLRQ